MYNWWRFWNLVWLRDKALPSRGGCDFTCLFFRGSLFTCVCFVGSVFTCVCVLGGAFSPVYVSGGTFSSAYVFLGEPFHLHVCVSGGAFSPACGCFGGTFSLACVCFGGEPFHLRVFQGLALSPAGICLVLSCCLKGVWGKVLSVHIKDVLTRTRKKGFVLFLSTEEFHDP